MKLAFVLFRYFPFGGLQRDFMRIAEACLARGHTIHVFTMCWEAPPHPNLPVTVIPVRGLQNHSRIQSFIRALPDHLKGQGFNRVIGFNKMPGLDVYYAADSCFQAGARGKHGAWFRLLPRYRALLSHEQAVFDKNSATRILLLCEKQRDEFGQFYQTPAARLHLLPPGIAKDRLLSERPLKSETDDCQILFVGSGFRTKGLDRAITAFAALPESLRQKTRLRIIGSDNQRPYYRLAKQLGIHSQIEFLGGRFDVPAFLATADLLIHPARRENTGTVLLEALASGLPVLTTDVCGYAHYIVEAKAGTVLSAPFRQADLNQALQSMLMSKDKPLWQASALRFAAGADIFSLPEHAAHLIESVP